MENRLKEHQLDLFSDRTSAHAFDANQLRLWFSSVAYVLMQALRQHCLSQTGLATAQLGTIRTAETRGNTHQRSSGSSIGSLLSLPSSFFTAYRKLQSLPNTS